MFKRRFFQHSDPSRRQGLRIGELFVTRMAPGSPIGSFGNFLTNRLATGAALSGPADVAALIQAGITVVIDCRAEFDDGQLMASAGLHYLWNPTADDGQPKPPEWFGKSISYALPLLALPQHRVYAHCAAGINRGPSTAYAILRAMGLSPVQAMAIVHAGRPQAAVRYAPDADKAIQALGYD